LKGLFSLWRSPRMSKGESFNVHISTSVTRGLPHLENSY